jgi:hypothetical protein
MPKVCNNPQIEKQALVGGWKSFIYEQDTFPPTRAMKFFYRCHDQHRLNTNGKTNVILGLEMY